MAQIYEKLKTLREQSGLRQGQIAAYLDVTQTFISKVETGERNLTVDQLENLANLYGYSLSTFADAEGPYPVLIQGRRCKSGRSEGDCGYRENSY